jgi:hypothetical protein
MATIFYDEVVIRQRGDGREILFTWPRTGETLTYTVSIDGGLTFVPGEEVITENPPDGSVSEYVIPYNVNERPEVVGTIVYNITDGSDDGKIYVNVVSGSYVPIANANVFTSLEEMQRLMSIDGVDHHTEDYIDPDLAIVINEIIQRATETVLQFLRGRYVVSDMAGSYWVRMKATFIACYYLSIRQGNASLYGEQYQESLMDLALARDGIINPGLSTPMRVVLQTPMMDSRFFHTQRIDPSRSTKTYSGQRLPFRLASYE